jgi:hypothetical protein
MNAQHYIRFEDLTHFRAALYQAQAVVRGQEDIDPKKAQVRLIIGKAGLTVQGVSSVDSISIGVQGAVIGGTVQTITVNIGALVGPLKRLVGGLVLSWSDMGTQLGVTRVGDSAPKYLVALEEDLMRPANKHHCIQDVILPLQAFREALEAVSKVACKELDYAVTGIHLRWIHKELTLTGADDQMFAKAVVPVLGRGGDMESHTETLYPSTVDALIAMLKPYKGPEWTFSWEIGRSGSDTHMKFYSAFTTENERLDYSSLARYFPSAKAERYPVDLIDKQIDTTRKETAKATKGAGVYKPTAQLTIERQYLVDSILRLYGGKMPLARSYGVNDTLILSISEEQGLTLYRYGAPDKALEDLSLEHTYAGPTLAIALNPLMLLKLIDNAFVGYEVGLSFTLPSKPILIKGQNPLYGLLWPSPLAD